MLALVIQFDFQRRIQTRVILAHPFFAEAVARIAPAVRTVKGKLTWIGLLKRGPATRTTELRAEDMALQFGVQQNGGSLPHFQRSLNQLSSLPARSAFPNEHLNGVFLKTRQLRKRTRLDPFFIHQQFLIAATKRPRRNLAVVAFSSANERRENGDHALFCEGLGLRHCGAERLPFHWQLAIRTMLDAEFCEEEAQEMINLRDGRHGRLATAPSEALLDGDGGRQARNPVHVRAL